jgi:murein DD-endopeptidase MepM/ murein hydrolase activator NlpD
MNISILRRVNLFLFVLTALLVGLFIQTQPTAAQTQQFLYRPYYGDWPGYTAWMDHHNPGTLDNWVHNRKGQESVQVCDTTKATTNEDRYRYCYGGHEGLDYPLSYLPVVAAAPGVIKYSGWHFPLNRDVGLGLMVEIEHNHNNTLYRTQYGHLSMIRLMSGVTTQRWQIGTSGNTGYSSGAHLHFDVRVLHNNSWKWTDPLSYEDTVPPSGADPLDPDSQYLFVDNPLQTRPARSTEHLVDDGATGYTDACLYGTYYWWTVSGYGYSNDHRYTLSNGTTVDCLANFSMSLPSQGEYEVEVYIPDWNASSRSSAVRYTIYHADPGTPGNATVIVDQRRIGGNRWISLGRHKFNTASSVRVVVSDNSYIGTYSDIGLYLLVDAVRLVRTH